MSLQQEFEAQGNWLFRWRGILPLVLVPFMVIAIAEDSPFEDSIEPFEGLWTIGCLLIAYTGFIVRCLIIGYVPSDTSGRNTKEQIAGSLNTIGFYSLVRHPLYFGNFLVALGIVLQVKSPWFLMMFLLAYALYYERIMFAEEAFLRRKFGETFERWAAVTPAFIPALRKMKKNNLTFSWKMVLRREYSAFLLIPLAFMLENYIEEDMVEQEAMSMGIGLLFLGTVVVFLVLRTLKKRTTVLDVPGR